MITKADHIDSIMDNLSVHPIKKLGEKRWAWYVTADNGNLVLQSVKATKQECLDSRARWLEDCKHYSFMSEIL